VIATTGIADGHPLLSDWLFLLAVVLFVVEAVAIVVERPAIGRGILVALGLAAAALGWLVL
jgi:hypothetical protein